MPHPKDVFNNPVKYWDFLTASDDARFEGQHFDRKEAGRVGSHGHVSKGDLSQLTEDIRECISAFANINRDGGLVVVGITQEGEVKGTKHLTDEQRNQITNFNNLLCHQAAQVSTHGCSSDQSDEDEIYLIYVPYTDRAICETPGPSPKAWIRQGSQNLPITESMRDTLRREKRIVDYEQSYCCAYDATDLDQSVLREFRSVHLEHANYDYSDEDVLYHAGALERNADEFSWKHSGLLFFSSNPQRVIPAASIRLLRFEVNADDFEQRGLPTFQRWFTGPITKQIRDVRSFLQQSGFFKAYQRRNPDGGFTEEPEYPPIAVDEAIVNAVAHRDYAMNVPVECAAYKDAFVVRNTGRILQSGQEVPDRFSLDSRTLDSAPRNPKLFEWLRSMRDERGAPFVQALSEGTKRMRDEMLALNLPAPVYKVSATHTTVYLYNNRDQREADLRFNSEKISTEAANLFPLLLTSQDGRPLEQDEVEGRRREIIGALRDALEADGWFTDDFRFGKLVAHRRGADFPASPAVAKIVRFYPAYSFQIYHYWGHYYLCIDYTLEVKNVRSAQDLLADFDAAALVGRSATAYWGRRWQRGRIVALDRESACVHLAQFDREELVASDRVIPYLPKRLLDNSLERRGVAFDLHRKIKELSLALDTNASRVRFERTRDVATALSHSIFPLTPIGMRVALRPDPITVGHRHGAANSFRLEALPEPHVEFNHHQEAADIREGITRFGAYSQNRKTIELIPVCTTGVRDEMAQLIERLKAGKYKYRGSERTFSTRLTYNSLVTVPTPEALVKECERLVTEHPDWVGDEELRRLFLVYTPEKGYASDNERSPYYLVKRLLLENGIPCQMLDTPILKNPDWKDLNLALNITAKCGVTPWVLPDAIPDADFFVGLSYTQSGRADSVRLMGYANVFNQYGRWEFYSGNAEAFPYNERGTQFGKLVRATLERLSLSETPSIYFHYSARFSREDRKAILAAARSVRPQGTYTFVWINTDHAVRLYDTRTEGDGSLGRGKYVVTSPNQFYLSTTGYNPYRRILGTPHVLEINVRTEYPEGGLRGIPNLRAIAVQVLNLTKLNWASTDSLCAEPITVKYARDIAYLTEAFLRQGKAFRLHPVLERTPWFI